MAQPSSAPGEEGGEGGEVVGRYNEAVSGNWNDNDGIRTLRLWLREARESDLDAFHGFLSDADVMKYWSGPPYTERSQSESYLKGMISSPNNGSSDFVIVLRSPDPAPVIGKVGIWNAESDEIGLMLSREYWGKGYMAEAFSAILEHLWSGKVGEVGRLVADVDPRNDASLRILKKFGFRQTGFRKKTIETHLGWCDSVYLALENPNSKGGMPLEEEADDVSVNGCINPNPQG